MRIFEGRKNDMEDITRFIGTALLYVLCACNSIALYGIWRLFDTKGVRPAGDKDETDSTTKG